MGPWFDHELIRELAKDPVFRGRLADLKAEILAGNAVTMNDASRILDLPYATLAGIWVEWALTAHPGSRVTIEPDGTVSVLTPETLN